MIHGFTAGRQASALVKRWRRRAHCRIQTLGVNRHAWAQEMIFIFSGIEHDLDRDALHDFHIISRSIFGRQKTEAGAAGAGDAIDFAVISFAIGINFNGDGLADFHLAELGFFEVGGDPDIIERNDLHQFLTRGHVLSDLNGATADASVTGAMIFVYCRFNSA